MMNIIKKVNTYFKPLFDIINNPEITIKMRLKEVHNMSYKLRNEFDKESWIVDKAEKNRIMNRLNYHKTKGEEK